MSRKILGILGGMGPYATVHFFNTILNRTKAEKDWDHLHIIIDNHVHIPSRTRAVLYGEESPVVEMRKACFRLMDAGCDYIAVPCNSAHYFYDGVVKDTDIPWVNMIEVVSEKLKIFDKVLITGGYATVVNKTYDKYLDNTVYLENNDLVFDIIEKVKLQKDCHVELYSFFTRVDDMNVDCVLLGCTELPMVINVNSFNGTRIINGNIIYADKLIRMCGGIVKDE